jgi:hypothetical protein
MSPGQSDRSRPTSFSFSLPQCYRDLGLDSVRVGPEQIQRAYRARAKQVHPDAGGSQEQFVKLRNSYEQALEFCRTRLEKRTDLGPTELDDLDLINEIFKAEARKPDPFFAAGAWDVAGSQRTKHIVIHTLLVLGALLVILLSFLL